MNYVLVIVADIYWLTTICTPLSFRGKKQYEPPSFMTIGVAIDKLLEVEQLLGESGTFLRSKTLYNRIGSKNPRVLKSEMITVLSSLLRLLEHFLHLCKPDLKILLGFMHLLYILSEIEYIQFVSVVNQLYCFVIFQVIMFKLFDGFFHLTAYDEDTLCVGFARLGCENQMVVAGSMKHFQTVDFGPPLHCLTIVGKTHPVEEEMLDFYRN